MAMSAAFVDGMTVDDCEVTLLVICCFSFAFRGLPRLTALNLCFSRLSAECQVHLVAHMTTRLVQSCHCLRHSDTTGTGSEFCSYLAAHAEARLDLSQAARRIKSVEWSLQNARSRHSWYVAVCTILPVNPAHLRWCSSSSLCPSLCPTDSTSC